MIITESLAFFFCRKSSKKAYTPMIVFPLMGEEFDIPHGRKFPDARLKVSPMAKVSHRYGEAAFSGVEKPTSPVWRSRLLRCGEAAFSGVEKLPSPVWRSRLLPTVLF
jgi:hypothetical protein